MNLFTTRTRQTQEYMDSLGPPQTWYEEIVRARDMVIAGPSKFGERFMNSVIVGFGSTFLSVFLGTLAAYGFSPLQGAAEGRPAVLRAVDPDDAADRGRDPDLPDVPDARALATRISG